MFFTFHYNELSQSDELLNQKYEENVKDIVSCSKFFKNFVW